MKASCKNSLILFRTIKIYSIDFINIQQYENSVFVEK